MVDNRWRTETLYKAANSERLQKLEEHPNELYSRRILNYLKDAGFELQKSQIIAPPGVAPDKRFETRLGTPTLPAKHKKNDDPRRIINRFPRTESQLYRKYEERNEQGRGLQILITAKNAERGVGKSTLATILAKTFDENWTADRATFTVNEFANLYQTLDPGSCIVFDDVEQDVNRRRQMSNANVTAMKILQGMRYKELTTIFTAPTPQTLDKLLPQLADFRIHIRERGFGHVYRYKEKDPSGEIGMDLVHRIYWRQIDDDPDFQALQDKKKNHMSNLGIPGTQQPSQKELEKAKRDAEKEYRNDVVNRMDKQGYTQSEIADALDISQSTVSRILS